MLDPQIRNLTWSWLLTFLAVAETESVAATARNLGLTPAAISRTVRLLEDRLGEQLFNRVGRSLALNVQGVRLRDAVREARDAVDRGLLALTADPFAGPLRVASLGVLTEHFVVPALIALQKKHPSLVPEHINLRAADANNEIARGQLDLAFHYEALSAESLITERLGQTTMSVYCGRTHPLFNARRVTQAQVLKHAFSVPQTGDSGRSMDGWPVELARVVGMRVMLLRSNLQVALAGSLLAVLPDVTAEPHVKSRELRRVPFTSLPPIEVFASYPVSVDRRGSVIAVLDAVRALLSAAASRPVGRRTARA